MNDLSTALRAAVVERADNRCEYCRLSQIGQEARFHIDHIQPRAAGGATAIENLALACVSCSLRKAARQIFPDPESGSEARLFNPRTQQWAEHFRWENEMMTPLTATARALAMNRPFYSRDSKGRNSAQ